MYQIVVLLREFLKAVAQRIKKRPPDNNFWQKYDNHFILIRWQLFIRWQ